MIVEPDQRLQAGSIDRQRLAEQLTTAGILHVFSQPEIPAIEELGEETFPFFSEALAFN